MEREGSPLEGGERAALGAQTPRAPRSARPRGARGRVRPGHASVLCASAPGPPSLLPLRLLHSAQLLFQLCRGRLRATSPAPTLLRPAFERTAESENLPGSVDPLWGAEQAGCEWRFGTRPRRSINLGVWVSSSLRLQDSGRQNRLPSPGHRPSPPPAGLRVSDRQVACLSRGGGC